jgi:Acetoacetate decarboxylase (ADC)
MKPAELLAVPGVAESTLDDATVTTLPAGAPGAPWECESTGIVWWGRARGVTGTSAAAAVAGAGRPVVVLGGMISYARTPVGPYHEVFGGLGLRSGRSIEVSIPFMAVDSRDSVVGGRQNWSLPKVLARFTGEPGPRTAMTASGDGWTVRVTARPIGPKLPAPMNGRIVQRWPDGVARSALLAGRGRSRLAVVTVEVSSSGDLGSWLRAGRHLGVITSDVTFTMSAAS